MDSKIKKIIGLLDSSERAYLCTPLAVETRVASLTYMDSERKLLSLASNSTCMISDVFILYAIGHMGLCGLDAVCNFLRALSKKYPSMSIVYETESVKERIRNLYRIGYIHRENYSIDIVKPEGDKERERMAIYSLMDDGYSMVSQKLHRNLANNRMIQAKPLHEVIGWAAAAHIGALVASKANLCDYLERVLRTKQVPSYFFPMEVKLEKDDVKYYTAVIPMFMEMHPEFETSEVYEDFCFMKYNAIKNYLVCRTTKGVAEVIVVVRDSEELFEVARTMVRYPQFSTLLDRIYFTGEGLVRAAGENVKKAFLQLSIESGDVDFKQSVPPFMK